MCIFKYNKHTVCVAVVHLQVPGEVVAVRSLNHGSTDAAYEDVCQKRPYRQRTALRHCHAEALMNSTHSVTQRKYSVMLLMRG